MNDERLKRALDLKQEIAWLLESIEQWEKCELPLNPCYNPQGYRDLTAALADRDGWAIYRRKSIEKVAARLEASQAEYKAL